MRDLDVPASSSEEELISQASSDDDGDSNVGGEGADSDGRDNVACAESEGAEDVDAEANAEAEAWDRGSQASTAIEDATDVEDFAPEYGEPTDSPVALTGQQGTFQARPIYHAALRL